MKMIKHTIPATLCGLLLSANTFALNSAVTLKDSHNQWPMFGGPDGSGHITTQQPLPLHWSDRTNTNIKWKTNLPAGGQSGIAVWGNRVFLTINAPLDTPPYRQLEAQYNQVMKQYQLSYEKALKQLSAEQPPQLIALEKALSAEQTQWQQFIKAHSGMQKAPSSHRPTLLKKLKSKSPQGKALTKQETKYREYIHQQMPELVPLYSKKERIHKQMNTKGMGSTIILYCLDSDSGAILWTKKISGTYKTMYNYTFSDATSPTPVTDGNYVWVINASGSMTSFTMDGKQLWSRFWTPTGDRPFNKQYDSIAFGDLIFNVEPPAANDTERNKLWNYLHAIDKHSGKTVWVSEDALTHYNTPVLGETKDRIPAVLIGRGGPHKVPEKPEGLSLIDIRPGSKGKTLWQWQSPQTDLQPWGATDIQIWNQQKALWITGTKKMELHQINPSNGKTITSNGLNTTDRYIYDKTKKKHILNKNLNLKSFERQPYTPVMVGDAVYFLVRYEPYIAYHDLKTGKNIQLEIPTEVDRETGKPDQLIWKKEQSNDQLNSQGQRHNIESRARGGGTQKAFLGTPIVVNNYIFFTNALGLTYVIDTNKPFGPEALVAVNDLGPNGETFSLNAMAYANGKLFHRTLKALYCIEDNK